MRQYLFSLIVIILSIVMSNSAYCQMTNPDSQPTELGDIAWYRSLEEAQLKAAQNDKPIFVLFQEVPGCSTCRNYGDNVLSHPLIVDVIENEFIPLAIYNNKGGADAKVLKQYDEPSWNNPVIRIINADGKNVVTRHAGRYDTGSLASYMKLALVSYNGGLPQYVDLILSELSTDDKNISEAYYSMYCFWTGEAKLGQIKGVVSTSPGFMNGQEVVKVTYDNKKTDSSEISNFVKSDKFTFVTDPSKFRIDRDPQYYLKKSDYRYIALSPSQRTKINSALASGDDPDLNLSPTQRQWISIIETQNDKSKIKPLYEMDLQKSWKICQQHFSVL